MSDTTTKYYRVNAKNRDYKGDRYFRVKENSKWALQLCVSPGNKKAGRAHCIGIYEVTYMTLLSNYFWNNKTLLEEITAKEFEAARLQLLIKLR